MANKKLLYFADPMCSWCWGFSPVIHEIANTFSESTELTIHLGGLRAGNTKIMDSEQRAYILNHWFNVNEASGQPFDFTFNMPTGFIYDTEPPCRAVKTMQSLNNKQALSYFSRIQEAFYSKNTDVTSDETLAELATDHDINKQAFQQAFNSEEIKQQTQSDFILTQQMRVNGFPSLIGQDGDSDVYLSQGFQLYPQVEGTIKKWLDAPTN